MSYGGFKQALTEVKGDYDWAKQVDIERQVASGWLAYAEGQARRGAENCFARRPIWMMRLTNIRSRPALFSPRESN